MISKQFDLKLKSAGGIGQKNRLEGGKREEVKLRKRERKKEQKQGNKGALTTEEHL